MLGFDCEIRRNLRRRDGKHPRVNNRLPIDRTLVYLALAALLVAIIQVTLGGVVRVTGSGLGCPDWPLCDGRVIPVFERAPLIEFSHRLVASVVGLLSLSVAVLAWRRYRAEPWVLMPSLVGLSLVLVAALLGAIVVWTELVWWVRLIHLGLAQGVVACMAVVTLVAWRAGIADEGPGPAAGPLGPLALISVAGVFLIILSGSYMVGYGAGSSCGTWPLCRGSFLPDGTAYLIHMAHRYITASVALVMLGAAAVALRSPVRVPGLAPAAWLMVAALAGQVLLGAWTVWAGFTMEMRAAHLGGATLMWTAVVAMATLHGLSKSPPALVTAPGVRPPEPARQAS